MDNYPTYPYEGNNLPLPPEPQEPSESVTNEPEPVVEPEPEQAAAKPRKRKAKKPTAPSAASQRRTYRKLLEHYGRLEQADEAERHLLAILLETTGANREQPSELAIAVACGTKPTDSVDSLLKIHGLGDPVEQLLGLLSLDDEARSRAWKVLLALELTSGSPSPSDPTGTSKRMLDALTKLEDHHIQQLEHVLELAKP